MCTVSKEEQERIIASFKNAIASKSELQDDILNISESTLDQISSDIIFKFNCFATKEAAHNFLLLIFSFVHIRPKNIPLYGKLFLKISKYLSSFISPQEFMILFSSHKLIILYLYEAKLIKIDDIISQIKTKKDYMFYFCNEIRTEDSSFFGKLVADNEPLEDFVLSIKPEEHDRKRREGLNDGEFETQIRQGLAPSVHPNKLVKASMYENSEFLEKITYAEYAAYFGSIEAVKYFLGWTNLKSSQLLKYAIAGGQKEVVDFLLRGQDKIKFKVTHDCVSTAIDFHTSDDIDISVHINDDDNTNITLTRFYTMSDQKLGSNSQAKLSKYSSWTKSIYDSENCSITINIKGKQNKNHDKPSSGMRKYVSIQDIYLSVKKLNWHYLVDNILYASDQINDPCDDEQTTLLHFACFFGYKEVVKLLLSLYGDKNYFDHNYENDTNFEKMPTVLTHKSFINVNSRDIENRTPLHLAVMNQKVENIKILLRCDDTDYRVQDIKGRTVIHYAAETKNCQIIRLFFMSFPNHIIDMSIPDKKGNTAFHYFCKPRYFDPKILKYVCSSDRINPNHLNNKNETELMHSILKKKRLEILEVLASSEKVDLNVQTPEKKQTALMIAARNDNLKAVQILMRDRKRINPNLQDFKLRTALHIAVSAVSLQCVDFLARQPNVDMNLIDDFELNPVYSSLYKRSFRLFDSIMISYKIRSKMNDEENKKYNLDFSKRDHFSQNLLHYAVRTQYIPAIEILLKFFDVNEPDSKGTSSFHLACASCNIDIIQLLVNKLKTTDIEPDVENKVDSNNVANEKVVCYRPGEKIRINMPDSNGMTPFHYACSSGLESVVSYMLLLPGIKVNEKDKRGETPFFYACKSNHLSVAKLLIKSKKVNPYATNYCGIPALSYLSEQDKKNVFV